MRSYPYLEIEGCKLSLVYPYTLNDRLIIDFQIDESRDYYDFYSALSGRIDYNLMAFIIRNDNNYCIRFTMSRDQLREICAREFRLFYENHREDAFEYRADYEEVGEFNRCGHAWVSGCFEQINRINEMSMRYCNGSYYENMKFELKRQRRYDAYITIQNLITSTEIENASHINFSWDNLSKNRVKLIHPYNYVPDYKKWYCDGEDKTTTLLLGAEIEVDEGGEKDETAQEVLRIIHEAEIHQEDKMFAVHDGSLNNGIEFVTMPCSLEFHKMLPYRRMFRYLDEHGYKGHDSAKAGLHIHINRDFFRKTYNVPKSEKAYVREDYFSGMEIKLSEGIDIESVSVYDHLEKVPNKVSYNGYYILDNKLLVLPKGDLHRGKTYTVQYIKNVNTSSISYNSEQECVKRLIYIVERFDEEFSVISRRNCQYSKLIGYSGEKCKELFDKVDTRAKYYAVNLLHKDSIELRMFKSTLKYETFINTLEFVSRLAYFVKDHTEEEVENMTWDDLYETFSDDLKSYYLQRKEIEDKKKAEKKDARVVASCNVSATDQVNRNRNRIRLGDFEIDSIRNFSLSYTNEIVARFSHSHEGSFTADNSMFNMEFLPQSLRSNRMETSNLTEIQQLEKQVKDIKRKLVTSNNYLERKRLEKDLCKLNKDLKKAKIKEKKENTNQN